MRTQRPARADAHLNDLEAQWWNENAATIARVWEMPVEVSRAVRGQYLESAGRYFLAGGASATILELGCGSGWVGQAIASPGLSVLGVDFSASQIELARKRAELAGVSAYCRYVLANPAEELQLDTAVDGVLLHAFLHHLDEGEVGVVLDLVCRLARPGARVWVYEPVFSTSSEGPRAVGSPVVRAAIRTTHWMSASIRLLARAVGLRNDVVDARFRELGEEANRHGWYLSPKEVPFDEVGFAKQLSSRFEISRSYWATLNLVGWAYECALLESAAVRGFLSATFLRLASAVDALAMADEAIVRNIATPPGCGFKVWECALLNEPGVRRP